MSTQFYRFLSGTTLNDVPDPVVDHARWLLLDLVAVAAGGRTTALTGTINRYVLAHHAADSGGARLLFDGRRCDGIGAALASGMMIDSLDGHDGHKLTKGHVGCGTIAVLLALLDEMPTATYGDLLLRLIQGFELGTRMGIALHKTACDYHTSGAWVAVSTAAIAARMLELNHEQTREAIGIAEYHGPRSQMMRCIDHPTMLKDGSGWGAMTGLSAARLAQYGFTGAPALLVESDDTAELWADLSDRWQTLEQYYKVYPVCRWAQPAIQAALGLRSENGLTAESIDRVQVHTFHEATRLATAHPTTTEQAQYSIVYSVACALVFGDVAPVHLEASALADPQVIDMCKRIELIESEDCNQAFPLRRFARVQITTGQATLESPMTEALGDPESPVSRAERRKKFDAYVGELIGYERANHLADLILSGGLADSVGPLLDAVFAPGPHTPTQRL